MKSSTLAFAAAAIVLLAATLPLKSFAEDETKLTATQIAAGECEHSPCCAP